MLTVLTAPFSLPLSVIFVLLVVLVVFGLVWAVVAGGRALEEVDPEPPHARVQRLRQTPQPATTREYLKALRACLRGSHDDVYQFRLGRPAHRCRVCGRWRKREVLTTWPGERRA